MTKIKKKKNYYQRGLTMKQATLMCVVLISSFALCVIFFLLLIASIKSLIK